MDECAAVRRRLDGRVKTITETALTHLLAAHPHAEIVENASGKLVRVHQYNIETDEAWTVEMKVIPDPEASPKGILPVFNVRTGPDFNPGGDARTSPLGHLYRIVGWTPPKKDDDG